MGKRGIPKEVLDELQIEKPKEKKPFIIQGIIEHHQSRLTIPKKVVLDLGLKKGCKFDVSYDVKKKEIIYKLK